MLTRRQNEILDVIYHWHQQHGYTPTLDEIAQQIGINTRSTIHQHVQTLIKLGKLKAASGKRAYDLIEEASNDAQIERLQLVGQIAAGKPIEAIPDQNDISPSDLFSGAGRYALQVRGESMVDIGIMDGDYVVIQQQESARNGEIVVALVEREEATLKRIYYLSDGNVELRPENRTMQSMVYPAQNVQVQGRMVGLFRNYS